MKMNTGSWILFLFIALIVIALAIAASAPISLIPMNEDVIEKSGMPLLTQKDDMADLPVLAESMPDFQGIEGWFNTPDEKPLTKEDLKGKVVVVDFWTYSCINCIRTQPVLKGWWSAYKDDGLVIIGVHTPEFAFEKDPMNVKNAAKRAGLEYPIALDPNYDTWNAYSNHFWPAAYFFDREGRLRFTHFGEGQYDEQEGVIRALLTEGGVLKKAPTGLDSTPAFDSIGTPETYFGYLRLNHFENTDELVRDNEADYTLITPRENDWSLDGRWLIEGEQASSRSPGAVFAMNVQANAMHVVLGSEHGPKRVRVQINGRSPADDELTSDTFRDADGNVYLIVDRKDLYRVARFPNAKRSTVTLIMNDPGVEFYAATFGE